MTPAVKPTGPSNDPSRTVDVKVTGVVKVTLSVTYEIPGTTVTIARWQDPSYQNYILRPATMGSVTGSTEPFDAYLPVVVKGTSSQQLQIFDDDADPATFGDVISVHSMATANENLIDDTTWPRIKGTRIPFVGHFTIYKNPPDGATVEFDYQVVDIVDKDKLNDIPTDQWVCDLSQLDNANIQLSEKGLLSRGIDTAALGSGCPAPSPN